MPSSTSSSEHPTPSGLRISSSGADRLTAADRPGVAQPVPERDVPERPWRPIFVAALVLFALLIAGWELYWRAFGAMPGYHNSDAEWAQQRRRIDAGEGGKTVLVGSSRVLFDVQLPVWEKVAGERPIQLAIEGTSSVIVLEDLAADPNFTGRVLAGVSSDLFFTGFRYRGDVVPFYRKETPSQRVGNWLSRALIEPYFAFDDFDFALAAVVKRQAWPRRPGIPAISPVRKLMEQDADRNTHIWSKLETDPAYRELARGIWAQRFDAPPPPNLNTPEKLQKVIDAQIQRAVDAVVKLRARGVQVLWVRPPTSGRYLEFDNKVFPRAQTWDVLLARTGAPGIHFEDYPELQGMELPEWSHLAHSDADRFTAALYSIIARDFWHAPPATDAASH
ncbi:MAG: hypothetical protein ABI846_12475 [Rudaea sp.]